MRTDGHDNAKKRVFHNFSWRTQKKKKQWLNQWQNTTSEEMFHLTMQTVIYH